MNGHQRIDEDMEGEDPLLTREIERMLSYPDPNLVTNQIPTKPRAGKFLFFFFFFVCL